MGIFSGLDKFGIGVSSDLDVYSGYKDDAVDKEDKEESVDSAPAKSEVKESDFLFDKTYECPVCANRFTSKTVKTGRVKSISHDSDLRPVYAHLDVLKYDAVVCPKCGFAAVTRFFHAVSPSQNKWIKEQITSNFKGFEEPEEIYSYDDAIDMHKLALMSTIVKRGRTSERAYCCLKLAWLLRGKRGQSNDAKEKNELKKQEREFIEKAYEGFSEAFARESFPMCGMDEMTVKYLVADLARQIGDYDEAKRWVSKIILSHNANERIKDKARELKNQIDSDKEQAMRV